MFYRGSSAVWVDNSAVLSERPWIDGSNRDELFSWSAAGNNDNKPSAPLSHLGMELHGDSSSASVRWKQRPRQSAVLKMEEETVSHFHMHGSCECLSNRSLPESFQTSHKLLLKETVNLYQNCMGSSRGKTSTGSFCLCYKVFQMPFGDWGKKSVVHYKAKSEV